MPPSSRPTRRHLALLAPIVALAMLAGGAAPALAAPYATEASVDSIAFERTTIAGGEQVRLDGTWSLPDSATGPAGLVLQLPEDLQGVADAFPLLDRATGAPIAQCRVTGTTLDCAFDDAYVAANPVGRSGDFHLWVRVLTQVQETTEVTYAFDEVTATVRVERDPNVCPECAFPGRESQKWGDYGVQPDGTHVVNWGVSVAAGPDGDVGGRHVTVTDSLGAHQRLRSVTILQTDRVGPQSPIGWSERPADAYEVSDDGSVVTFTTEAGWFYDVRFLVEIDDAGASGTYDNAATIAIEGERTVRVEGQAVYRGGGGSGIGSDVGRFAIAKRVVGDADAVPGMRFTGTYRAVVEGGTAIEGSFDVADGETWTSPDLPRGAVVTLAESTPTGPEGVTWSEPVFSQQEFALEGGTLTSVVLTNEATVVVPPTPAPSEPAPSEPAPDEPTPGEPTPSEPAAAPSETLSHPAQPTLAPAAETRAHAGAIPSTGVEAGAVLAGAALALLLAGLLVGVAARRRRASSPTVHEDAVDAHR